MCVGSRKSCWAGISVFLVVMHVCWLKEVVLGWNLCMVMHVCWLNGHLYDCICDVTVYVWVVSPSMEHQPEPQRTMWSGPQRGDMIPQLYMSFLIKQCFGIKSI